MGKWPLLGKVSMFRQENDFLIRMISLPQPHWKNRQKSYQLTEVKMQCCFLVIPMLCSVSNAILFFVLFWWYTNILLFHKLRKVFLPQTSNKQRFLSPLFWISFKLNGLHSLIRNYDSSKYHLTIFFFPTPHKPATYFAFNNWNWATGKLVLSSEQDTALIDVHFDPYMSNDDEAQEQ